MIKPHGDDMYLFTGQPVRRVFLCVAAIITSEKRWNYIDKDFGQIRRMVLIRTASVTVSPKLLRDDGYITKFYKKRLRKKQH